MMPGGPPPSPPRTESIHRVLENEEKGDGEARPGDKRKMVDEARRRKLRRLRWDGICIVSCAGGACQLEREGMMDAHNDYTTYI
jgi:hypothetical protein